MIQKSSEINLLLVSMNLQAITLVTATTHAVKDLNNIFIVARNHICKLQSRSLQIIKTLRSPYLCYYIVTTLYKINFALVISLT